MPRQAALGGPPAFPLPRVMGFSPLISFQARIEIRPERSAARSGVHAPAARGEPFGHAKFIPSHEPRHAGPHLTLYPPRPAPLQAATRGRRTTLAPSTSPCRVRLYSDIKEAVVLMRQIKDRPGFISRPSACALPLAPSTSPCRVRLPLSLIAPSHSVAFISRHVLARRLKAPCLLRPAPPPFPPSWHRHA